MIIYRALLPNGKSYIGQTNNFKKRLRQHKNSYILKNNYPFYRAIRKYKWNNLIWEIIDIAGTEEELNEKEKYWIKYYNTFINAENSNGYNLTFGGEGTFGYKHTIETKKKMSIAHKGFKHSNETKLKISNIKKLKQKQINKTKNRDYIDIYNNQSAWIMNLNIYPDDINDYLKGKSIGGSLIC